MITYFILVYSRSIDGRVFTQGDQNDGSSQCMHHWARTREESTSDELDY